MCKDVDEKISACRVRRLVVDTDGGADDLIAVLVAARSADTDLTITTVGGNVSAQQAAQNVAQILGGPVHVGVDPVGWRPEARHGLDGMHGTSDGVGRPVLADGVDVLRRALADPETAIACIGPMTNLAAARASMADETVCAATVIGLGGVVGGPVGLRDTNRALDIQAARDVSRLVRWMGLPEAARLSRTARSLALGSRYDALLRPFADRTGKQWCWPDSFPLYDAAVVCAAMGCESKTGEMIRDVLA